MSLGGGVSTALDTAVRNSIADGVVYAVAAGNSNTNAANSSPARVGEATVDATTINDARSSFSNFGSVVDIFAPGSSIQSSWLTSDTATATLSGTSMATPHVAGVAARILQSNPGASPATVRNEIVNTATLNHLSGIPSGAANRLLFRSSAQQRTSAGECRDLHQTPITRRSSAARSTAIRSKSCWRRPTSGCTATRQAAGHGIPDSRSGGQRARLSDSHYTNPSRRHTEAEIARDGV
jgi:subtilisin family serine protease